MRQATGRLSEIVRSEPRARAFLLAYTQSSVGTFAAAPAIVVLAYERLHSPWSISLVLLASFLPPMLLGPLFGAAVDRWSRRGCAIAADLLRAVAFLGIGLIDNFALTVVLAAVAGVGTGLYSPAALASLPTFVEKQRLAAFTALYGAAGDFGRILGPLVAAALIPLAGAGAVMNFNAATFAISALALCLLRFGARTGPAQAHERRSLRREAREGIAAVARLPIVRVVMLASNAVFLFAGMMNVAELLFARRLGASAVGYSLLVGAFGAGVVAGSLLGSRAADQQQIRARYIGGIAIIALALVFLSLVPAFWLAVPVFALVGLANGIVVVNERLLLGELVPEDLKGRAFALLDTLGAWAFTAAYVGAGVLLGLLGARGLMAVAGIGCAAVWAVTGWGFRRDTRPARSRRRYTETSAAKAVECEASTARTASS